MNESDASFDLKRHESPTRSQAAIDEKLPTTAGHNRLPRWWRFALLLVLLNCTLFWEGCRNPDVLLSVGPVGPVIDVEHGDTWGDVALVRFSMLLLILNMTFSGFLVWLVAKGCKPWAGWFSTHTLLASIAFVTLLFNSILVFVPVWVSVIGVPTMFLAGFLISLFQHGDQSISEEFRRVVIAFSSRLYFVACVALVWGLLLGGQAVMRKYFFIRADRWQFSLSGLVAVMVIAGTLLGMLLRLLIS